MRRDLIIGILVSIAIHGGAAWLSEAFGKGPVRRSGPKDDTPTIQIMEMPKIEPDEPEKVDTSEEPQAQVDFAPPMATDVPQIVTVDSFVQQVQPPPPEGLKPNVGVINIPQGRPGTGLGKGVEIFDIKNLDQQPVVRARVPPQYPFEMRRAGITGEVLVEFIVDSNGDVRNAFAVRSTQREFETAAVQAVSKWKFRPGKKGGRSVNTRMQQPISFSLAED
jgi:protein TonB